MIYLTLRKVSVEVVNRMFFSRAQACRIMEDWKRCAILLGRLKPFCDGDTG